MKDAIFCGLIASLTFGLGVLSGLSTYKMNFVAAQCAHFPTGKHNTEAFEVNDGQGKVLGLAERVVGHEWATVCSKTEWK